MTFRGSCKVWECLIVFTFFVVDVFGYYCDNDKCNEEEYCCGENMCCKSYKVWDLWYFWCGFLFFMLMLSVCTCMWRYRITSSGGAIIIKGITYSPLQQMDTESQHPHGKDGYYRHHNKSVLYPAPVGSPPPYNQVSAAQIKMAAPPPPYAQVVGMREAD